MGWCRARGYRGVLFRAGHAQFPPGFPAAASHPLLGGCVGLFFYNMTPARLFLGDSGAQTLGFLLASVAILYTPENYPQASSWFLPILVLGVPIFDTCLVVFLAPPAPHTRLPCRAKSHLSPSSCAWVVQYPLGGSHAHCCHCIGLPGVHCLKFTARLGEPSLWPDSSGWFWDFHLPGKERSMNDLDPRAIFERLLRFWWVLSLAMILGAMLGWAFSRTHPPVYEATAYYRASVDEQALIKLLGLDPQTELDFLTVNNYLTPLADLFYSPDIRDQVIAALQEEDITLAPGDFNTRNFILDRRGFVWFITARDSDPDRAVKMADIWLQTVDHRAHEFQNHLVNSRDLDFQNSLVERCFADFSFTEANQCAGTAFASLPQAGCIRLRTCGPDCGRDCQQQGDRSTPVVYD